MNKTIALLTLLFMFIFLRCYAQDRTLTGKVSSSKNQGIPDVSVVVVGTTIGTTTDIDGQYRLSVPATAKQLRFSEAGMKTKSADITNSATVDVVLKPNGLNSKEASSSSDHPYYYGQFRTGMLGGFQVIKHDSAYVTLDIPFELNLREFPKSTSRHYFEESAGWDLFVLNQNVLITAWGVKFGYGIITKKYNYDFQFHVGYLHGNGLEKYPKLKRYTHMLNLGYVFEASSIPVVIDLITPLESKLEVKWNILQVGIKLPFYNKTLSKEEESY